jgi:RNA polymerase sigma-70 factor (ECF subfamily)
LSRETLLQTFKKIDGFEYRGEGAFQAYLRQVLLNRIRQELRNAGRRPDGTDFSEEHVDQAASPLERAIGREAIEDYERALDRLKPEEREAIIARVEMGLTYEELATALDKPSPDAARQTARRALRRLIDQMNHGRG